MRFIWTYSIPFLLDLYLMEVESAVTSGHTISVTLFKLFSMDVGINRRSLVLTVGIYSLYSSIIIGAS